VFGKKNEKRKMENFFYKFKKLKQKAKEKNYFREIRTKNFKMDQQQNRQCQKGPRQSGCAIKSCIR